MPKVLIVSFHYSPLEIIASERAKNMALFLPLNNWQTDILTHDWQQKNGIWDPGEINTEKIETISSGARIIRVGAGDKYRNQQSALKSGILKKYQILKSWSNGWLDYRAVCRDGHESMENWLKKNAINVYDLIIGIYSPHSHLKLLSDFSKLTKTPIHFDFRDLWDNAIAGGKTESGIPNIQQYFIRKYWKKWIHSAHSLSSVSSGLSGYLQNTYHKKCYTLYTGFDEGIYPQKSIKAENKFKIVHAGTLYNNQKIEVLLYGISRFLNNHPSEKIEVHFPGLIRPGETSGTHSYLANASELVQSICNDERVYITPRIPQKEARQMMVDASVLIKPTFPDNPGIVGGKMFEYLGARRFIISAPNDYGSIENIIKTSKSGVIVNDSEAVLQQLELCYKEWKSIGDVKLPGNETDIKKYSANSQMCAFVNWLNSSLPL